MTLMLAMPGSDFYSKAMSLEQEHEHYWNLSPAPFDVHGHPRVFDAITKDSFVTLNDGSDGKAGLKVYSEGALRSGIAGFLAMPNESVRLYDRHASEETVTVPYPIASLDRVRAMQAAISHESVIPVGVYLGIDPERAFRDAKKTILNEDVLEAEFEAVREECIGLKVYLAETTGGYNIAPEYGPQVAAAWYRANPEKPVVFHVEGSETATLLDRISRLDGGREIPVHIAHVSSREELQAVITAKQQGMNVSCEATPHHLFLDESVREQLGGYGCMKPSLKSSEDIAFLWANMRYIDIFASDCAPHRRSDKEAETPAFGITNHAVMLPLLFGAAQEGRLTVEEIYQKLCVTPRQRFNLPLDDGSETGFSTESKHSAQSYEEIVEYGYNPFARLGSLNLLGEVVVVRAGVSCYEFGSDAQITTSYRHLIRPKNF